MMLATKFARRSTAIQATDQPLSDDQLRQFAPSIFQSEAHASRSQRYTYVPTSEVLRGLRSEGFQPFFAAQSVVRDESKHEYTKHMLRMRHDSGIVSKEVPEIILVNSHDGSTSYQMLAGMFKFVCMNGLVCGDLTDEIRVHHKGDIVGRVIEGAHSVVKEFERVTESAEIMKSITLSDAEQNAFANSALVARYGERDAFPVTATQILQPKRVEDDKPDLWTTFNRVQEHIVLGGDRGRAATGRRSTTREVRGISQNVALNRALWTLADAMAKIKQA